MPDSPEGNYSPESNETLPKSDDIPGRQILLWRKALGLPMDISPLDLTAQQNSNKQKAEQERQQALEDHINKTSGERKNGGVITKEIQELEESRNKVAQKRRGMPIKTKLQRLNAFVTLRKNGFNKTREIIELLDERYDTRLYPDVYSQAVNWYREEITNINRLDNPKETLRRSELLGIPMPIYGLKGEAVGVFLKQLEGVPKEKFLTFLGQLDQLHFIKLEDYARRKDENDWNGSHERIVTPSMELYLDLSQKGGFTPEKMETLRKMDTLYQVVDIERTLGEALEIDASAITDRETIYGELLRRGRDIGSSLDILIFEKSGLTPILAQAIRAGFTLSDDMIYHFGFVLKDEKKIPRRYWDAKQFMGDASLITKLEETLQSVNLYLENPGLKKRVDALREGLDMFDLETLPAAISLTDTLLQIEQKASCLTPEEISRLEYFVYYADRLGFHKKEVLAGLFFPKVIPLVNLSQQQSEKIVAVAKNLIPKQRPENEAIVKDVLSLDPNFDILDHTYRGIQVFAERFIPQEQQAFWKTYADTIAKDSGFCLWLLKSRDEFPNFFDLLSSDSDGLFLHQLLVYGTRQADYKIDASLGERVLKLRSQNLVTEQMMLQYLINPQANIMFYPLWDLKELDVNEDNWQPMLHLYVASQEGYLEELGIPNYDLTHERHKEFLPRLNEIFESKEAKNLILEQLNKRWLNYLSAGDPNSIPLTLILTTDLIKMAGGAGPLSQVESLAMFVDALKNNLLKPTTVERTKAELISGLHLIEEKFKQERWSNEDKSNFYNISKEMLRAAPSLYTEFLSVFSTLNPNDLKRFTRELYPLYKVRLSLMETAQHTFDARELVAFRKRLGEFGTQEDDFSVERNRLFEDIRQLFTKRFGIVKIPEDFTSEHLRSVTNMSLYLSNMAEKTTKKETILGLYLALMLNNQWSGFRKGENIEPMQLLTSEKAGQIKEFLAMRIQLDPLTLNVLGILPEDISAFQSILQQESQHIALGNIETIDVKLINVTQNLEEFLDEDLYPEEIDKEMLRLLVKFGNKKVGAVAAKMYQQFSGKQQSLNEDEREAHDQLLAIMTNHGLDKTTQTVKEYFQDRIKPLATIVNLLTATQENRIWQQVEELRDLLNPKPTVIAIFKKLDEEFTPTSGAYALSQDLSYLENLVVKRESELSTDEKDILNSYIGEIRMRMEGLESIYAEIKKKLNNLRQIDSNNQLLTNKIADIANIVNRVDVQQVITSTMTSDMNLIVENIRECLSCTKQGSNNDTDLTFGDSNKFYIYSQSEAQKGKGSLADQIVIVTPVTYADGKVGAAFVLDRLYGLKTPDILLNHTQTALAKYRSIQARFPGIKLSLLVSQAAMQSAGMSSELLRDKLKSLGLNCSIMPEEHIKVNVNQSAAGDHYIEFGGSARNSGEREVEGIVLRI